MGKPIVIKIGSDSATQRDKFGNFSLHPDMTVVAEEVVALRAGGRKVALVSSGAVAMGRQVWLESGRPALGQPASNKEKTIQNQYLASIGQTRLVSEWNELLNTVARASGQTIIAAQALFTKDVFTHTESKWDLVHMLEFGFTHDPTFVPLFNGNDACSSRELRLYDNDEGARYLATTMGADLYILTKSDGIYNDNPNDNPDALPYRVLLASETMPIVKGQTSSVGTGGPAGKLKEGFAAAHDGHKVFIGLATDLSRALRGEQGFGTWVIPVAASHYAHS